MERGEGESEKEIELDGENKKEKQAPAVLGHCAFVWLGRELERR